MNPAVCRASFLPRRKGSRKKRMIPKKHHCFRRTKVIPIILSHYKLLCQPEMYLN